MAGVLKVRDAGGTLRTITAFKVRDAGGTLRTLSFIKVRDAGGTLREVFTSGGGGGNPTSISPGYYSSYGNNSVASHTFTASSTGGTPTSYSWGLLYGTGYISGPSNAASAVLQVYAGPLELESAVFYCDMVIGGITYRATCQFDYGNTTGT